ncbi:MAG: glutamine--fructose-6-phosphate transaminase (isomerizing) [Gammaproteobacteria bacterium]|nr:MAG: glutamine--fructose-6-phosphate transaminase (isomerizing) [Gammaproteobacteria bacterium]
MCGIVGAVAQRDVAQLLIEGLKRLEYRGYDSAGMVVLNKDNSLQRLRRLGKVEQLQAAQLSNPIGGGQGIAHTRWATHGVPNEANAHPHVSSEQIAVVHNGIIENYEKLRDKLKLKGYQFTSDTDTETIVHLIHDCKKETSSLIDAVRLATKSLEGAYGIAVIDTENPGNIIAARQGSPLVIGIGIGENFIASDQLALLPVTNRFIFLEEGEIAIVTKDQVKLFDADGQAVFRDIYDSDIKIDAADKGDYQHFMQKEIHEQPEAVANTLEGRFSDQRVLDETFGPNAGKIFDQVNAVQIVACGTSYHAGLVAKYWIEDMASLPCQVEVASEVRYRKNVVLDGTLFITISQSGETADTLAALRETKENNKYVSRLSICNVPGSSMVRESDLVMMTRAGVEIGVASTKAFTTQLAGLLLLVVCLARRNGLTAKEEKDIIQQLKHLPKLIANALGLEDEIEKLANSFADKFHTLFLGRGTQYPIAMEGALKLKEISYIHAEAYPAGELKHGPLALVDSKMPVVAVAPNNQLHDKLKSNLEEVRARGGRLIVFADEAHHIEPAEGETFLQLEGGGQWICPIVFTIPLQVLSYHVAVIKGTDVDQPRNLAKSVTVE